MDREWETEEGRSHSSMLINKRSLSFSTGSRTPGELPPQTSCRLARKDGLVSMQGPPYFSWMASHY